ncbi:hypothetical protein [Ruminococcus sp.]|uniref:stage III sporulation protein AE n=1 Tax=Ruminococcus sp. TaxID=41978 RepID=UPI0025FD0147|nr:hypothetical protein [Ruminococcus sp.]MCI6616923.1 stage III sporulation protein AE [Ruminococcus sp.]
MKKFIIVTMTAVVLICLSVFSVSAEENSMLHDLSGVYDSLSDDARQSLENIGAYSADPNSLSEISFSSIVGEIANMASQNISSPLKGLINLSALLLLCSILTAYKGSLTNDISNTINIVSTLCITCAVVMPAINVIKSTASVIETASNIMLAYLPVMLTIMVSSGRAVSGASYYSMMLAAGEGVGQLSSKIIVPLLNMFLGISVTSSVSPDINLSGFVNLISKTVKWLLSFAMMIFSALLSFKQIITTSLDDVTSRAVRFSLNSFIPIVGSALSDAYKTVQGSITLLKSGVGVFVIISIAVVFLPVILQSLMWIVTLWLGKSTAEVLNLPQCSKLLESVAAVFSTLLAIILCIMAVYIISTAIILITGGGAG